MLFQKIDNTFVEMTPEAEATARADPNSLFGNDSGFEILLPAQDALAIRAQWGANAVAAQTAAVAVESTNVVRRSYVAQLKGQAVTAQKKGNTARAISLLIQAQEFING